MRRTPSWVFVAGAMVQLAVLGLCVYVMERSRPAALSGGSPESPPAPEPPAAPVPPPATDEPRTDPAPAWSPAEPPPAALLRTEIGEMLPSEPRFGPPPAAEAQPSGETVATAASPAASPAWLREGATPTSQLLRGALAGSWVHVVFHPDRSLKLVDADGGRYIGRVIDASADLREIEGSRTLRVRIGVAEDGRLQLSFAGGPHDAETVVLDDVIERA